MPICSLTSGRKSSHYRSGPVCLMNGAHFSQQGQSGRSRGLKRDLKRASGISIDLAACRASHVIGRGAALTSIEPQACRMTYFRCRLANCKSARMIIDFVALALPRRIGIAKRLKTRLLGAAPAHFPKHHPPAAKASAARGVQLHSAKIGYPDRFGEG